MPPPELAADAPVLNVVHPLEVGFRPVVRNEANPAVLDSFDSGFGQWLCFHEPLVRGVATYALELFRAAPDLDVVYVPIGMGSGCCGLITVRDLLGLKTEIVGVVSAGADCYAQSFEAGRVIATNATDTVLGDGMDCRSPWEQPVEIIVNGAARVVRVTDDEIAEAMRAYYTDTHNIAEGAGRGGRADKRRFYLIARGSAAECSAIYDLLLVTDVVDQQEYDRAQGRLVQIVKLLSAMARNLES